MASKYVGIETARKTLGDLVDDAQSGTDVILTRNGRAVARLTAYTPEDTVQTIDLGDLAAAVIARARADSGLTAAEFDYDIAVNYDQSLDGVGGQFGPLGNACHAVANEGAGPLVNTAERAANANALWANLHDEMVSYARRCKDRKYAGWSSAARSRGQRITYAD